MKHNSIIKVENLVAGYGQDIILNNITFEVHEGEIFIVLGGSGCGKSTLLKHLIGLIKPISGSITLDGEDFSDPDDFILQKVLRKIGVLYQSAALFGSMTIAENIALPINEYTHLPEKAVDDMVRMKMKLVGLEGYEDLPAKVLSQGQKRRVALARLLLTNARLWILDEPFTALDVVAIEHLRDTLQAHLAAQGLVVLTTHQRVDFEPGQLRRLDMSQYSGMSQ